MTSAKKIVVYAALIIVVICTLIFVFFSPKVTISFAQNGTLTSEEKNQITSAINWKYKYNPRHVGGEYLISIGELREITNPEKMDYDLFIKGSVKAAELIDSTGIGDNSWMLVVAKDKAGDWKLVGDVLCCAQGMEWY